jgi:hypothetical protein
MKTAFAAMLVLADFVWLYDGLAIALKKAFVGIRDVSLARWPGWCRPSGATFENLHTVVRVAPISGEHLVWQPPRQRAQLMLPMGVSSTIAFPATSKYVLAISCGVPRKFRMV